jgi:predicted acyltransferase
MVHYSDRHKHASGMTFVDVVFPAFLFIVGMSIPFALRSRQARGEAWWKILLHVVVRTASLLLIGVMMVNAERWPDATKMGWSPAWWQALLFGSSILAFCTICPPANRVATLTPRTRRILLSITIGLRLIGFATIAFLAFAYVGKKDQRIITLHPFSIRTQWWGILGLIGWAYFAASVVYLIFRNHRTALLVAVALMTCFYAADKHGFFDGFTVQRFVNMGDVLGSQAAISVAGVMLATILLTEDTAAVASRVRFTLLFVGGFALAAMLLNGLYGISKNDATPSWCLWSSAITAALWLIFYLVGDVARVPFVTRPFAVAGQNVLLAYLLSEGLGSWLIVSGLSDWYERLGRPDLTHAIARSVGCAVVVLTVATLLNRAGFRLKL